MHAVLFFVSWLSLLRSNASMIQVILEDNSSSQSINFLTTLLSLWTATPPICLACASSSLPCPYCPAPGGFARMQIALREETLGFSSRRTFIPEGERNGDMMLQTVGKGLDFLGLSMVLAIEADR